MTNIKFVSCETFTDDPYIKELVYLCIDDKYRVAYVRKQGKNGGLFWGVINAAINKNGSKVYYEAFLQDSNFLEKDIKAFLDERKWEKGPSAPLRSNKDFVQESVPF